MYHDLAAYMSPVAATYTMDDSDLQDRLQLHCAMTGDDQAQLQAHGLAYDPKGDATHFGQPQFAHAGVGPLQHPHPQLAHSSMLATPGSSSTMMYPTPLPSLTPPLIQQHAGSACQPPSELHSMQYPQHPPAAPHEAQVYYETSTTPARPMHLNLPEHRPPPMSLALPVTPIYDESGQFISPQYRPGQISPYQPSPLSAGPHSASSTQMTDYFPPYQSTPITATHSYMATPAHGNNSLPYISPPLQYGYNGQPKASGSRSNNAKTGRQQFSACGACRHRRVKCDLREKQEKLQKDNTSSEEAKAESKKRPRKAICSNCEERGIACIDEYAPLKAAKQLRRGKRISEIEVIYGKPAADVAAMGVDPPEHTDEGIPELSREFFESAFFRRFQVQRPIIDPHNFTQRYLAAKEPNAASMGAEGAVLCHVLYAWALSYGVDHRGELDIPEGGGEPLGVLSVTSPCSNEMRREADRQNRFENMRKVVEMALREIDDIGIMRKPTWDGVRVLLLILPLTEGIASPVERLAMYETALNQVYTLCSYGGLGYDGLPSGTSGVNGGEDKDGMTNVQLVRVRIYWYAFVHEGITTGLKGGRLHLDDEDLETMQDAIHNRSVVVSSTTAFNTTLKFATAPIHLALACRLINRALTGPSAKRKKQVNADHVKEAWEALERSWEEFEALKSEPASGQIYKSREDVVRFADGWKIFLFEAQNVIRQRLIERLDLALQRHAGSQIVDASANMDDDAEIVKLRHLVDIAKSKCEVKTRQILTIVRRHVGSRFFEWDASLVRDGTFYAAKLLPGLGMPEEDMGYCLQALNELRWAHAKAFERSTELRKVWVDTRHGTPCSVPSIDLPAASIGPTDGTPVHTSQSLPTLQMTSLHLQPLDPNHSYRTSALSADSNPGSVPSGSVSPLYPTAELVSPTAEFASSHNMVSDGATAQSQSQHASHVHVQQHQQQQAAYPIHAYPQMPSQTHTPNTQHSHLPAVPIQHVPQPASQNHTPVTQYSHLPPAPQHVPQTAMPAVQALSSPYAPPYQLSYGVETSSASPYQQHHQLYPQQPHSQQPPQQSQPHQHQHQQSYQQQHHHQHPPPHSQPQVPQHMYSHYAASAPPASTLLRYAQHQHVPPGYAGGHMLPASTPNHDTLSLPGQVLPQTQAHQVPAAAPQPSAMGYAPDGYMYADMSASPRLKQFDGGYYPKQQQ